MLYSIHNIGPSAEAPMKRIVDTTLRARVTIETRTHAATASAQPSYRVNVPANAKSEAKARSCQVSF
jgi:hypothetical protein